jgi:hypothetical protein
MQGGEVDLTAQCHETTGGEAVILVHLLDDLAPVRPGGAEAGLAPANARRRRNGLSAPAPQSLGTIGRIAATG